jgi:hypothetical protein
LDGNPSLAPVLCGVTCRSKYHRQGDGGHNEDVVGLSTWVFSVYLRFLYTPGAPSSLYGFSIISKYQTWYVFGFHLFLL